MAYLLQRFHQPAGYAAAHARPAPHCHHHNIRHTATCSSNTNQVQKTQSAEAEQAVPEAIIQRLRALEQEVQQAYQVGYKAGYTAGVKVQVHVDLQLPGAKQSSNGSNGSSGSTSLQPHTAQAATSTASSQTVSSQTGSTRQKDRGADASSAGTSSVAAASQEKQAAPATQGDSLVRSAVKGLIWRLFSTTATVSIALVVLHDVIQMEDALKIGGLEFVTKYLLYFLHERMWAAITFI